MISVNGSTYEGGGGLMRSAIAYSSLLNQPIRLYAIRANRPNDTGLQPGHNTAITTMKKLTAALVEGNSSYSPEILFTPHIDPKALEQGSLPKALDITLESSVSLLLVAVLPYLLLSRVTSETFHFDTLFDSSTEFEFTLRGGMLCVQAPSIFYMRQVFLPTFSLVGINEEHLSFGPEYEQGWHTGTEGIKIPGKIVARIKPLSKPLKGFILRSRGRVQKIQVTAHVPSRARQRFEEILESEINNTFCSVEVVCDVFESLPNDQYHLLITAVTASPSAYLGYEELYPNGALFPAEIKDNDEEVAFYLIRACIRGLWKELSHGNAVDEHMEDILAIYQTMASGFSSVIIKGNKMAVPEFSMDSPAIGTGGSVYDLDTGSVHRQTTWWIAKHMTGVEQEERIIDGRRHIGCTGLGLGSPTSQLDNIL